jgi:hypothetical protein
LTLNQGAGGSNPLGLELFLKKKYVLKKKLF